MDLLSDILSRLQLSGTLYFRTSFTSPWGVRVPEYKKVSRFHFAHRGRCMVRVNPKKAPVQLEQGDLVIITRGASHTLYCEPETESRAVHLEEVVQKSGFSGHGTLVYGESGTHHETQLICGHFSFDDHVSHPLIDALPEYIHIKNYGEAAGSWMESTLKLIGAEAGRDTMGCDLLTLKMSEIIYVQVLRTYLNTEGKNSPVLAGFADERIARALKAIHDDPAHPWTLDRLSSHAGLSRTAFATKFAHYLTMTPLHYITQWRMQIARQLLIKSNEPIIQIAENTGYQSEAAFGRVFKRYFDLAPATYRRQHLSKVGQEA